MAIQPYTLPLFLTFFTLFLISFSNCQLTFHPSSPPSTPPSFPPRNDVRPPPNHSIPTSVAATSGCAAIASGLLVFACCRFARHGKKDDCTSIGSGGGGGGGGAAVTPYPTAEKVKEVRVDQNVNVTVDDEKVTIVVVEKEENVAPPPPPPPPPLPPPILGRRGVVLPPPPPKGGGASSSPRPPLAPNRTEDKSNNNQVKLKALHWEKVNVCNRHHSMVWDNLEDGSFQYNGDMMEALFGKVATPRTTLNGDNSVGVKNTPTVATSKIMILDPRRSQNIAIVIRSLGGIPMKELIEGLLEGKGLNVQILEKLTRIIPTKEEKLEILSFDGEVETLCDAESFLYRLLKAVPLAFTRVNAMLFRYTYDSEIQHLKVTLKTLDSACDELRSGRVFLKLLEATLKAGNKLNAGTARGEATAFNLTALLKLSDYKSSDKKSTLLHFVVREVVRNEGRRWVMKTQRPDPSEFKLDQETEFLRAGLPIVNGLSSEFSNVKKSASIDHHTLSDIGSLGARLEETRKVVLQCGAEGGQEEFVKEMEEFLGGAEGEIKAVQEEEDRVMKLVKKTTQYYQAGGFKEKQPLELFAIVTAFLNMVDKACENISRSFEEKKSNSASSSSTPSTPDVLTTQESFPKLSDVLTAQETSPRLSDVLTAQETSPRLSDVLTAQETSPRLSDVLTTQETFPRLSDVSEESDGSGSDDDSQHGEDLILEEGGGHLFI